MSHQQDNSEILNRGDLDYQKWLGKRSCSTYSHSTRRGRIYPENDFKKVDYMFSKKIKMILIDCDFAVFLLTEDGEVYHWWDIVRFRGIIEYFSQLVDLRYSHVMQTAVGGGCTFIILTDDSKVFYFQIQNNSQNWMKQMYFQKEILSISCGKSFFVVLTADNKVYTWGKNDQGQLGNSTRSDEFIDKPHEVKFTSAHIKIVRVACGYTHTLALSNEGDIFVWGGNTDGELGCNSRYDTPTPQKITITPEPMKILDVAAMKNMSCAISEDKLTYVWGSCFNQEIRNPVACEYTTLFDMCNALSARPPTNVRNFREDERFKVLDDIRDSFNNPDDSDLVIKIGRQSIHVHKFILQNRTSYFKKIDQFITSENDEDVIRLNEFSYAMYYAYFKYLYTAKIDVSLKENFNLLEIANALNDNRFEESCYKAIKKEITEKNLFKIYKMAQKYKKKKVEEFCFEFFEKKTDMMKTPDFEEVDEDTKNIFMARSANETHD